LALVHIGVPNEVALAMVVSQHLIQWMVVGAPGAYFFIFTMRGKIPEPNSGEGSEMPDLDDAEDNSVKAAQTIR
jgi:hypothetical protein